MKKQVLVLSSPFSGIRAHIRDARCCADQLDFQLASIRYSGKNRPDSSTFTYNKYNPADFNIQRLKNIPSEDEVTSLRLSDVFQTAEFSAYKFSKENGISLKLVRDLTMYSLYSDIGPTQDAIEYVSNLIADNADGVMPVWSRFTGGAGFRISMENIYNFFKRIKEHRSDLKIKTTNIESESLSSFLQNNF